MRGNQPYDILIDGANTTFTKYVNVSNHTRLSIYIRGASFRGPYVKMTQTEEKTNRRNL